MKKYELALKNEKEKSYRTISLLLLALNFISIVFLTYSKGFTKWGPLILSLLAALSVLASFYFKNKNEKMTFTAAFFLFSLAWDVAGYWMIGVLNLFFSAFNLFSAQKPMVSITETVITYPIFPKRKIYWNELSNMVLKDGLLTIDFKNNKLIQQNIAESSTLVDEKEFNEFCNRQLNK